MVWGTASVPKCGLLANAPGLSPLGESWGTSDNRGFFLLPLSLALDSGVTYVSGWQARSERACAGMGRWWWWCVCLSAQALSCWPFVIWWEARQWWARSSILVPNEWPIWSLVRHTGPITPAIHRVLMITCPWLSTSHPRSEKRGEEETRSWFLSFQKPRRNRAFICVKSMQA